MDDFDPMVLQDAKKFTNLYNSKKLKLPNMSNRLITDFDVEGPLDKIYILPYNIASETYVWSFQYRLLNYILFTNVKLLKIGLLSTDQCTFCNLYELLRLCIIFSLNAVSCRLFGNVSLIGGQMSLMKI